MTAAACYQRGDFIARDYPDGHEFLIVLAVDSPSRVFCVDMYDGFRGGWLDLSGTHVATLDAAAIEQRFAAIERTAASADAEAARHEEIARSERRSAERRRAIVEHARRLAATAKAGPR